MAPDNQDAVTETSLECLYSHKVTNDGVVFYLQGSDVYWNALLVKLGRLNLNCRGVLELNKRNMTYYRDITTK